MHTNFWHLDSGRCCQMHRHLDPVICVCLTVFQMWDLTTALDLMDKVKDGMNELHQYFVIKMVMKMFDN